MFINKKTNLTLEKLIIEINKADRSNRISQINLMQIIIFMPLLLTIFGTSKLMLTNNDEQMAAMIAIIFSIIIHTIINICAHKLIKLRTTELVKRLTYESDQIVWIYKVVVTSFFIPLSSWFDVCFIDKKTYRIDTYGYKSDEVQNLLKEIAVHAIVGFNYNIMQIYNKEPASLKTIPNIDNMKFTDKNG